MAANFDLDGGVLDGKVIVQGVRDAGKKFISRMSIRYHEVDGQGSLRCTHCPHVQIMHFADTGQPRQVVLRLIQHYLAKSPCSESPRLLSETQTSRH